MLYSQHSHVSSAIFNVKVLKQMSYENNLSQRLRNLLEIMVSTYIKTGRPVGSEMISQSFHENLSSATIRNEMHVLEEAGFIEQPHTSAGRIPTDSGYRYYVDYLMPERPVAPHVTTIVAREYRSTHDGIESLVERTSKILSELSIQAGFITFPDSSSLVLSRIEIAKIGKSHLLVVWMMGNGFVHNRTIEIKDEIPADDLKRMSEFLNSETKNLPLGQIRSHLAERLFRASGSLLYALITQVLLIVDLTFPDPKARRIAIDGSRHILDQPEFQDPEKSRKFFRALEQREIMMDMLEEDSQKQGVCVRIGVENSCVDVQDCSFVTSCYRLNEQVVGNLGVVGPRRMAYSHMVGLVDHIARRLSETLEQW